MHPGIHAGTNPDKIAYQMADSGYRCTYRELDEASNRGAQLFRRLGLGVGDHLAILLENHPRFFEICWAAQRSGLYYTAISHRLQAEEVKYIVGDCGARVMITSKQLEDLAIQACADEPQIALYLLDGDPAADNSWDAAAAGMPTEPVADQCGGATLLYSSGTTGQPKGVKAGTLATSLEEPSRLVQLMAGAFGFDESVRYLSPAPLYHAAPLHYNMSVMCLGGTSIIMEQFDPERALGLIQEHGITHSQWVPTMFVRMLKLDPATRAQYDLSGLKVAIHAAAPCPIPVKEQMIAWWGEVLYEYYAGTEGNGFTAITTPEWLGHRGSVGKALVGELHILDDDEKEVPVGTEGTVYFADGGVFEYHNAPEKTRAATSRQGYTTLGDVGYLDEEGYLYLTDRKAFMIISGGVNIYPQEVENCLIMHPAVMDVAVFGVPDEEFGEQVKAVVQPVDFEAADSSLGAELLAWCRERLSHIKCPKSVDFERELPRHPTGKLYKRLLRDRYWQKPT